MKREHVWVGTPQRSCLTEKGALRGFRDVQDVTLARLPARPPLQSGPGGGTTCRVAATVCNENDGDALLFHMFLVERVSHPSRYRVGYIHADIEINRNA